MRASSIAAALVERLAVPGPRYTSYPPANVWGDLGPESYAGALRAMASTDVGVYVHVPYCKVRCGYCGLNVSGSRDRGEHASYVDAVLSEASLVQSLADGRLRAAEVAWGGGTPTSLEPSELERLGAGLLRAIPATTGARLSVEVDPRVTTRAKLEALRAVGFRRVSIGVQDLDPEVQDAAGRVQSEEQSRGCLETARALGFEGANVDLMYGLPKQTPDQLRRTVERVLTWAPERVTLFGYAHLPSRFPNQRRIREADLPDLMGRLDLLLVAAETLEARGYRWLGLDHFVREDDELWRAFEAGTLGRNFMGYVPGKAPSTIALGASSIGFVEGLFVQNDRDPDPYMARSLGGHLATVRGYRWRGEDALRADLIERLMCQLEVDLDALGAAHGVDARALLADGVRALAPLETDGLVERRGARVTVTPLGRLFLRNVCMLFDQHVPAETSAAAQSRTV